MLKLLRQHLVLSKSAEYPLQPDPEFRPRARCAQAAMCSYTKCEVAIGRSVEANLVRRLERCVIGVGRLPSPQREDLVARCKFLSCYNQLTLNLPG